MIKIKLGTLWDGWKLAKLFTFTIFFCGWFIILSPNLINTEKLFRESLYNRITDVSTSNQGKQNSNMHNLTKK